MGGESHGLDLIQVVALLGAAVFAVPIFKRLGLGSVLGYLAAGVAIGPFGFRLISATTSGSSSRWSEATTPVGRYSAARPAASRFPKIQVDR